MLFIVGASALTIAACGSAGSSTGTGLPDGSLSDVSLSLGDGAAITCKPKTCQDLGYTCGPNADTCGGLIDCGTCTSPEYCGGGGRSKCGGNIGQAADGAPLCTPKTCADYPAGTCGVQTDGCGGVTADCLANARRRSLPRRTDSAAAAAPGSAERASAKRASARRRRARTIRWAPAASRPTAAPASPPTAQRTTGEGTAPAGSSAAAAAPASAAAVLRKTADRTPASACRTHARAWATRAGSRVTGAATPSTAPSAARGSGAAAAVRTSAATASRMAARAATAGRRPAFPRPVRATPRGPAVSRATGAEA